MTTQTEPTNRVDLYQPRANWIGCVPCPECGSKHRWPTSAAHPEHPRAVRCECGFAEKIAEEQQHGRISQS